jgi:arylamine N-acetyltransferase
MTATATMTNGSFVSKYFARLGLDPSELDPTPTIEKLRIIQEAHLAKIPFENLSQHGCRLEAVLDVEATAAKVLDSNRGGFCFELNALLGEFLLELGYRVCRVHSTVHLGEDFFDKAVHLLLFVTCLPDTPDESLWLSDVGFGEPALHPLSYDVKSVWDQVQVTPEGMQSKLVRADDDMVHLMWFHAESGSWMPRLRWKYHDALLGNDGLPLSAFDEGLELVLHEESIFAQKVVCCLLTREGKRTLAGNRLKVTGPPRFIAAADTDGSAIPTVPVPVIQMLDAEEAREILCRDFGIPIEQTEGFCLVKSKEADAAIWDHK